MKKLIFILLTLITIYGCGGYNAETAEYNENLKFHISLPDENSYKRGLFDYDVKIAITGIDIDNKIIKEWKGITAGNHTLSIEVPEGEDRVFEIIIYRNIEETEYPIFSSTGKTDVYGETSVNLELKRLFVTIDTIEDTISGEYPLIEDFVKEINGDLIHAPDNEFGHVSSEYFLPIDNTDEISFENTKIILKDFIKSTLSKKGILSIFYDGGSSITENFYISEIDLSSQNYTAPFGLPGYTSSLFEYDGNGSYKMYLFSNDLSVLKTDNVTIDYIPDDISVNISPVNENDTIAYLNIPQLSNTTCDYSGYFKETFYPSNILIYKGTFTVNENLNNTVIFPKYGETSDSYFSFKTFSIKLPALSGNYSVNTYNYTFDEILPEQFVLATVAIDKLFDNLTTPYLPEITNGTEIPPIISYINPNGYSSLYTKIESSVPFASIEGNITSANTVETNDTGVFEGITTDGKFIKVKTTVSVTGNQLSLNLNPSLLSEPFEVKHSLSDETVKLLIDVNSNVVDFCDIHFLDDSSVKDTEDSSPIGEYSIIKIARESLLSVKRIPSSTAFLETSLPSETKYIKISCYNNQKTFVIGKVLKVNSEVESYNFSSITKFEKLNADVFEDSMNFITRLNATGTVILSNNKTLETVTSNETIPIKYLINMAPNIKGYVLSYSEGKREDIDINVNVVGNETVYPLSTSGTIYLTWEPDSFNTTGECKFNVIDSDGGYASDDWSVDYTEGAYYYPIEQTPEYIYAARFCKVSDGNFSITAKIFKTN